MPESTGAEAYMTIAVSRLEEQMKRIEAIDSKIAHTFTFTAALVPAFGVAFAFLDAHPGRVAGGIYGAALGVYIALLVFSAKAYLGANWSYRPDLPALKAVANDYTEKETQTWIADECARSIHSNEPHLIDKARWAFCSFVALGGSALLLSASALVALLWR